MNNEAVRRWDRGYAPAAPGRARPRQISIGRRARNRGYPCCHTGESRYPCQEWVSAFEAVGKLGFRSKIFCFVVPARAGTLGFQSLALGPRFRGGDDL